MNINGNIQELKSCALLALRMKFAYVLPGYIMTSSDALNSIAGAELDGVTTSWIEHDGIYVGRYGHSDWNVNIVEYTMSV
jgi:hypothetical protein